ncbi:hypothetical protein T265_02881 [Opisthorchis viverrini]|uniref:Serine/threonine-protein phosphatase n=1 Tax=Opisthorchis viverrini TaxID=6198 RepID=A0A075A576_OPIVI|nr:hypothetical protein T265_02881 [Opisthorchis viverrini]KER30730.1 hypothetical protein T265_02881 [Opisthorchis viverrini]
MVGHKKKWKANKVNGILKNLLQRAVKRGEKADISEPELLEITDYMCDILLEDPVCLDLDLKEPICIVGDLFGQYMDLIEIFEVFGFPPGRRYLFLGNYCDRGPQSLEVICLLFILKLKFPKHIFMLRGNHECEYISCHYGFLADCTKRFSKQVWHGFMAAFNCLPATAIIEDIIFCAHSGLVPCLQYTSYTSVGQLKDYINDVIRRPVPLTHNFLLTQLAWSEPVIDTRDRCSNPAGLGEWFGEKEVEEFCDRFGFELFIRSHDFVKTGYEFMANGKLLTVFSASHFGGIFQNLGAAVMLEKRHRKNTILGRITVIRPTPQLTRIVGSYIPIVSYDSREYQAYREAHRDRLSIVEGYAATRGTYVFFT